LPEETNIALNLTTFVEKIDSLHNQPLEVIQEFVKGEWKMIAGFKVGLLSFGGPPFKTFLSIDTENSYINVSSMDELLYRKPMNGTLEGTSFISWEYKNVYKPIGKPCCSTYVMQFNRSTLYQMYYLENIGWYFQSIINDTLNIVTYFTPDNTNFNIYERYRFLRIKQ
jgi:hypothetical protein